MNKENQDSNVKERIADNKDMTQTGQDMLLDLCIEDTDKYESKICSNRTKKPALIIVNNQNKIETEEEKMLKKSFTDMVSTWPNLLNKIHNCIYDYEQNKPIDEVSRDVIHNIRDSIDTILYDYLFKSCGKLYKEYSQKSCDNEIIIDNRKDSRNDQKINTLKPVNKNPKKKNHKSPTINFNLLQKIVKDNEKTYKEKIHPMVEKLEPIINTRLKKESRVHAKKAITEIIDQSDKIKINKKVKSKLIKLTNTEKQQLQNRGKHIKK